LNFGVQKLIFPVKKVCFLGKKCAYSDFFNTKPQFSKQKSKGVLKNDHQGVFKKQGRKQETFGKFQGQGVRLFRRNRSHLHRLGFGGNPSENAREKATTIVDEQVIRQTIKARKAALAGKAKKTISAENSQQMREALKKKKSAEIDAEVLIKQEELDNAVGMTVANENGG
jgi:hypothetical protein